MNVRNLPKWFFVNFKICASSYITIHTKPLYNYRLPQPYPDLHPLSILSRSKILRPQRSHLYKLKRIQGARRGDSADWAKEFESIPNRLLTNWTEFPRAIPEACTLRLTWRHVPLVLDLVLYSCFCICQPWGESSIKLFTCRYIWVWTIYRQR